MSKNNSEFNSRFKKLLSHHYETEAARTEFRNFFAEWARHDRGAAKKAAFDHANDERFLTKLLLVLTFVFVGGFAAIFLSDAYKQTHCNKLFAKTETVKTSLATINKIKKNRRGNITWAMNFTTAEGKEISGVREAINPETAIHSPGKKESQATVVYSSEDSACWDVSLKANEPVIAFNNRSFSAQLTFGFGMCFALIWMILSTYLWKRITRHIPYRDVVESLYDTI